MKTVGNTACAFAILIMAGNDQAEAFSPLSTGVRSRILSTPHAMQRRMVMDKPDPVQILDKRAATEIEVETCQSNAIQEKSSTDPTPFFYGLFEKTLGMHTKQQYMRLAAGAFALALAMMPLPSVAAMSGGRMGGSYSRSLSAPTTRTYSSPSRGYSRGYSQGYASGYYSRPSVAITPGIGFGYNPFYTPYYGGGAGMISYARGPSFFDVIFFGGLMFALANIVRNAGNSAIAESDSFDLFGSSTTLSALGSGTSVVQVSVALEVPNRDDPNSILSVLNRLSQTSKTDSRMGIQNLTSQVALELLRRRSSIFSASSSYKHYKDNNKASRDYEAKAIKERSKFESETVSKYGGVNYSSRSSSSPVAAGRVDGKATMAVVTLVMAIDGDSTKVPQINSVSDLEEALRRIASDSKVDDCLQSVEILWTPEDPTEMLSRQDVIADYPELRAV